MSKPCDALKFSTRSEQEQYWALKPLRQKMQPNDIITKPYTPDVQPQVILVVNNDERKNNLKYVPPKTRSHELQNYAHLYNQFDYLGHYCAKRINQIVFLKFNNTKYNLMADSKQRTRVMGAFYVPFHQIFSQNQQLFTKKLGLKFPNNNTEAVLPLAKQNRGCCHDPLFCSSFETGNLFAAIRKSPFDYELILQNDVNSCAEVSWFNFSVEFTLQGYYSFCIKNMTKDMRKVFERGFRVNYCFLNNLNETIANETIDDWNPIGENIKYQQNEIQIEGEPGEYYYDLYFQYRCKNKNEIVAFALDRPYNTLEAEKYFNEIAPKKLRGLTKIEKIQYGKTMSGSALNAYHIRKRRAGSDLNLLTPGQSEELNNFKSRKSINLSPGILTPLAQVDDKRHRSVVILSRLSGADVSGSSVMEGMVDFLLETIDYDMLKRNINFYFIPMSNIDSVKYGNSLTNLSGSNLYDSWRNPHRIYHAQLYHLKNFMNEINKDSPISHVFNFTSEYEQIYSSVIGTKNEDEDCEDSRIFPFVLSKRHRMFSFEDFFFYEKNSSDSMTCVLTEMFPKVLAYEFRISRFQLEKEPQDTEVVNLATAGMKQCRPQSYFNFGRKFMEDYLEHVKIYDKNSLLKDKWLRQIQQIEDIKPKMAPNIITQLPVETRFPESFYSIGGLKPTPVKAKVKTPRKFDPYSKSRRSRRAEMDSSENSTPTTATKSLQVKYVYNNFHMKQAKQNDKRIESIDQNIRKTLEKVIEKSFTEKPPFPQFRIREKAHQVLKNCSANLMSFQMGIVSNQKMKKQTDSPYMSQKDRMRKELSMKKLKKIKNDNSFRKLAHERSLGFLRP